LVVLKFLVVEKECIKWNKPLLVAMWVCWQDMKLNVRKWHYLDCIGMSLASLAALLGAGRYMESYQRDLRLLRAPQALESEADAAGTICCSLME